MISNYVQYISLSTNVTGNYNQQPSYDRYPVDETNMCRKALKLRQLRRDLADAIKKFGEGALLARIVRDERERQIMLDSRSRGRAPHKSTKRKDSRRLSTYEAAMAMRQLKR